MKKPKISIVTIVYNSEKEIERTILSVIAQKDEFKDLEYIIVDGASNDNTLRIINNYIDDIDLIISEKDDGISDAFNKGILASNGDWINFLNAGDTFYSNSTLNIVNNYLDSKYDIIFGDMNFVDESGKVLRRMTKKIVNIPFYRLFRVLHQSTFHNKNYFKEFGLYSNDYKRVMDLELLLRKRNLLYHHINEVFSNLVIGGVSQSDPIKTYEEIKRAYKKNTNFSMLELEVNKWRSIMFHYGHIILNRIKGAS